MTTQQVAFQAYYARMTDAELLSTAANARSFIEVAQKLIAEEMRKRGLPEPALPAAAPVQAGAKPWFKLRRRAGVFRL